MADSTENPTYKYFKLTYPIPYVALVEINRPEKMNAFIEPMWHELSAIFTHLSTSPSTRAIILTSTSPRAFTTGLDISSPTLLSPSSFPPTLDPARRAHILLQHITTFQSCISSIASCAKPVIAAIHGYCYGLGVDIAVCADVRVCSADARFSVKEVDIGIAADIGTLTRLGKVVGNGSWVKDVCLSAREWGAEEAGRVGFCSWVASEANEVSVASQSGASQNGERRSEGRKGRESVTQEALRWATTIAAKSPVAVQGTKEILDWSRDHSTADGLRYTAVWNAAMVQSEDVGRAMRAGVKRERPRFEKL